MGDFFLFFGLIFFKLRASLRCVKIKLCMKILQAARRLSRMARAERCHWSKWCNNNVRGHCRKGEPHTTQVMLGVSLQARWYATLVIVIVVKLYSFKDFNNDMHCC